MKKHAWGLIAAFMLLAGCVQDGPVSPEQMPEASAPAQIRGTAEEVQEYVTVLSDITERLLPSLVDQSIAEPLAECLTELASALIAGDGARGRAALTVGFELMENYEAENGFDTPDSADLSGIYINLWYADYLIGDDDTTPASSAP